jgi:GT2 family glycosyltransferase
LKRIAVAILNWNGEKFLRQFLPNVVENSKAVADVYVIDNDSKDGSVALLKKEFPGTKSVLGISNVSFGLP